MFRILRYAGIGQSRNLVDLPSWVPDWTACLQTFILSHRMKAHNFRASLDSKPRWSISEAKRTVSHPQPKPAISPNAASARHLAVLRLDAVIFDRISRVIDIFNPSSNDQVHHGLFQRALKDIARLQRYPTGQSMTEAFWRTTVADSDSSGRPAREEFLKIWQDFVSELGLLADDDNCEPNIPPFQPSLLTRLSSQDKRFGHLLSSELSHSNPHLEEHFCSILGPTYSFFYDSFNVPLFVFGRKLCLTEKGYLGLVPQRSLDGDTICIFLGAETPHIIRPCEGDDGRQSSVYQLVGECYIHGIMDGEILKKPYETHQIHLI